MNTVIAALDGLKLSESTLDYAIYVAKKFKAHIVAAFLEDETYHLRHHYSEELMFSNMPNVDTATKTEDQVRIAANKKLQRKFEAESILYNIHSEKKMALRSLLDESYYADMILIDGDESFSNLDASKPSHFIRNLLSGTQCPVMVVPSIFKPVERIVFAYDGSLSSVYAIKQFSYLFPLEANQEVEILMVTDYNHTNQLGHLNLLKELLKRKYTTVIETVLKSNNTDDTFIHHLETEKKNCMIVLGAYQRSSFSRWLYQSIADTLIAELDIPLFVAHK
jgi:nucleotide-binding universal stress UspA family protein